MSFRGDSGMPSYKRGAYMDTGEVAEWKKMDLRPDPHRQNQMRTGSRSRAVNEPSRSCTIMSRGLLGAL